MSLGELWGYYSRYPYLTRVRDRTVLVEGVESALGVLLWQIEGFALADGYDQTAGRYLGLVLPGADARISASSLTRRSSSRPVLPSPSCPMCP